jgi:hypothetical protein
MRICSAGAELFRADGWTEGQTKLIVDFHNFANAPKNYSFPNIS